MVPGTANPVNSQLQRSHNKLYRNKIFDHKGVGRYPCLTRLLKHFGHF